MSEPNSPQKTEQQHADPENAGFENTKGMPGMMPPPMDLSAGSGMSPLQMQQCEVTEGEESEWRESGNLTGNPPVRNECPPNIAVKEDFGTYSSLLSVAEGSLGSITELAAGMKDGENITDHRYWFTKVYQYVTEGELDYVRKKSFHYPSYVLRSVLYFEKIYRDNLNAKTEEIEAHWATAFAETDEKKDDWWIDFFDAAQCITASMLAHIRYDLPRAEAWVFQSNYAGMEGVNFGDFRSDFMSMAGIFDVAAARMNTEIYNYFSFVAKGLISVTTPMAQDLFMNYWNDADMTSERADTWRRAEMLVEQGLIGEDPYTVTLRHGGGEITGDATLADNESNLQQLPDGLAPSMDDAMDNYDDDTARDDIDKATYSEIAAWGATKRVRMLVGLMGGSATNDDEKAAIKLLKASTGSSFVVIVDGITAHRLLFNIDGAEYKTVRTLLKSHYYAQTTLQTAVTMVNRCNTGETAEWEETMVMDILAKRSDWTSVVDQVGAWNLMYNMTGAEFTTLKGKLQSGYYAGMSYSDAFAAVKKCLSTETSEWEEEMIMDILIKNSNGHAIVRQIGINAEGDKGDDFKNLKNGLNELEWTLDGGDEDRLDNYFGDY